LKLHIFSWLQSPKIQLTLALLYLSIGKSAFLFDNYPRSHPKKRLRTQDYCPDSQKTTNPRPNLGIAKQHFENLTANIIRDKVLCQEENFAKFAKISCPSPLYTCHQHLFVVSWYIEGIPNPQTSEVVLNGFRQFGKGR
jgi:hypothetical protein